MAKLQISNFMLLSRRSYGVAAENLNVEQALSAMRKAKEFMGAEDVGEKKMKQNNVEEKTFWMRDPKTGNWIPENHFGDGEIDAADLRNKFLSRKDNF